MSDDEDAETETFHTAVCHTCEMKVVRDTQKLWFRDMNVRHHKRNHQDGDAAVEMLTFEAELFGGKWPRERPGYDDLVEDAEEEAAA